MIPLTAADNDTAIFIFVFGEGRPSRSTANHSRCFFCPNSASVTLNPALEGSVTEEYPNSTGSMVSSAIESSEFLNTPSMSMSQGNKAADQEKDLEMKTIEGVALCK